MIEVNDISFSYSRNAPNVLERISFDIEENRCIAVLGNNGAGKSTLIKCIDRIYQPQRGTVLVNGKDIMTMSGNDAARNIAYVSQGNGSGSMTVFDAVLLGRKPYIRWDATARDKAIVGDVLERMNLSHFALRNISELSGGEAQKVMLARALAQSPGLLLLDEPTSNLDPHNQHEVLRIVREIAGENNTCVMIVIHDLNLAIRYCDGFIFLKDSVIHSYGGLETITPEIIGEVYNIDVHVIEYRGVPVIIPYPRGLESAEDFSKKEAAPVTVL